MDNFASEKQFMKEQTDDMVLVDTELSSMKDKSVTLVVGGTSFTTKTSTLKSIPGSTLSTLTHSSPEFCLQKQAYCFDRDPGVFKYILNAHRDGDLHVPNDICAMGFRKEMKFWGIPHRLLAPCCWKQFYSIDEDLDIIDTLLRYGSCIKTRAQISVMPGREKAIPDKDPSVLNQTVETAAPLPKLWLFLEEPGSSTAAKIWCFFYILVVITSVITFIIWLEPEVRVESYLPIASSQPGPPPGSPSVPGAPPPQPGPPGEDGEDMESEFNEKLIILGYTDPHPALLVVDSFCSFFFIIETLVHFYACPHKQLYAKNAYNVMRIFLVITMTLSFVLELRKDLMTSSGIGKTVIAIKGLNCLRLALIFRLRKVYSGLQIMLLSLERSAKEFLLLMFMFMIAVVIYGGMIFCMEIDTDAFPDTMTSMWWAIITMTTVGYGDYYPTHALGYVVGFVCAINGLIVIALPVAAIASNFSGLYARSNEIKRHAAAIEQEEEEKESVEQTPTKW